MPLFNSIHCELGLFALLLLRSFFCAIMFASPFQLKNNYGPNALFQTWFNCLHSFPVPPTHFSQKWHKFSVGAEFFTIVSFSSFFFRRTIDIFVISLNVFFCLKPYWMFWLKSFIKVSHCSVSNEPLPFRFLLEMSVSLSRCWKLKMMERDGEYFLFCRFNVDFGNIIMEKPKKRSTAICVAELDEHNKN